MPRVRSRVEEQRIGDLLLELDRIGGISTGLNNAEDVILTREVLHEFFAGELLGHAADGAAEECLGIPEGEAEGAREPAPSIGPGVATVPAGGLVRQRCKRVRKEHAINTRHQSRLAGKSRVKRMSSISRKASNTIQKRERVAKILPFLRRRGKRWQSKRSKTACHRELVVKTVPYLGRRGMKWQSMRSKIACHWDQR